MNRGQPKVIDDDKKHKDIVFTAFCGDGSCLAVFIATADQNLEKMEVTNDAHIGVFENIKAPTNR